MLAPAAIAAASVLGPLVIQGIKDIIGAFHKDDPAAPKLDPQQGTAQIFQQLMPLLLLASATGKDGSEQILQLLMQQYMPQAPATLAPTAITSLFTPAAPMAEVTKMLQDITKQIKDIQDEIAMLRATRNVT